MSRQSRSEREEERMEADFLASPQGRAYMAKEDGARFFQVDIPHTDVTGFASNWTYTSRRTKQLDADTTPDTLGDIEGYGWTLIHANFVYVTTGENSRKKLLGSGEDTVVQGQVVGIYLFRNNDPAD